MQPGKRELGRVNFISIALTGVFRGTLPEQALGIWYQSLDDLDCEEG
jgi:hypothetical protein